MSADTPKNFANQEELTGNCHISDLFFRLEGNKLAHVNPPYDHSQEQRQIRLWKRLTIDNDPDRFVLFSSAFCVLLFKYTHNENIEVEVQKEDKDQYSEGSCARFAIITGLKNNMSLLDVANQIFEKIKIEGENSMERKGLIEKSPADLQKTNVLFLFGSKEDLSDKLKYYSLIIQIIPNKQEPHKSATISAYYSPEVFDTWYVSNLIGHYKRIIYRFIAPTTLIQDLKMISTAECNALINDFNRTEVNYPSAKTIHEQFEEQVVLHKDKTAIAAGERSLSYLHLNDAANRLGNWLKGKYKIIPDDVIGLLLGRSEKMIVGMLGVLKAGGAFLPIDASYPINRIKYMLDDAAARVLVSESKYIDLIKNYSGPVLLIDKENELKSVPKDNLPNTNTLRDLAYVMYTSGSTGNPKGVPIEHRGLFNTQFWRRKFYGFNDTYVTLQIASFSFDSSINDIFSMLMWGGTLVIMDENERLEMKSLSKVIVTQSITNFNVVTSYYNLLIDEIELKTSNLRIITLAGEKLTRDITKRHFDRFPHVPIVNEYGPAENSICSTATKIKGTGPRDAHIGKPIYNTRVYILGAEMEIIPPGVSGEIHLSGVGLTRGYLNHPELSSEKFIENPYVPGERLYKTADLGRWLPDGNIEFLGRKDDQVKIRGVRIEPREIEIILRQHDLVREAVVIPLETDEGHNRLSAFVVTSSDNVSVPELRSFMTERLSKHVVPNYLIKLDSIPLMPNGKVDRQKLLSNLKNEIAGLEKGTQIGTQDSVELKVLKIWERLLHVRPIGLKDNFFELGGDSLLAARMLVSVENMFEKWIPISKFLNVPTIEGLATNLRIEDYVPTSAIVTLRDGGSRPPFFLIHNHAGGVLEYHALSSHFAMDQPLYALPANYPNEAEVGNISIEELAAIYLKEIKIIQPEGPYYIGGYCLGGLVAFEIAQQIKSQGDRVAFLAMIQTTARGYPVLREGSTFLLRILDILAKRMAIEMSNLQAVGTKGKLLYLLERIKRTKDIIQSRIEMILVSIIGANHPWSRRRSYVYKLEVITRAYNRAFERYVPKSYFGDAVIFPAAKQPKGIHPDSTLGWGKIIRGNVEIFEISGHQQNMLKKYNVAVLAEKLKEFLSKTNREEEVVVEKFRP